MAKGDQVLASRIDQALQQNLPLDELSADRRSLPPNMRFEPMTLSVLLVLNIQSKAYFWACLDVLSRVLLA